MLRVISTIEKNVVPVPTAPVVVAGNTSTMVLPDISKSVGEFSSRYIYNNSASNCYYSFGATCSTAQYNGIMLPNQQLACNDSGCAVFVFSTVGTTIAVSIFKRNDLYTNPGLIPAIQP